MQKGIARIVLSNAKIEMQKKETSQFFVSGSGKKKFESKKLLKSVS